MIKIKGAVQLVLAVVAMVLALATAVNLGFILTRPESVSVVNALIGQSVLIICLAAAARVLFRRGRMNFRAVASADTGH